MVARSPAGDPEPMQKAVSCDNRSFPLHSLFALTGPRALVRLYAPTGLGPVDLDQPGLLHLKIPMTTRRRKEPPRLFPCFSLAARCCGRDVVCSVDMTSFSCTSVRNVPVVSLDHLQLRAIASHVIDPDQSAVLESVAENPHDLKGARRPGRACAEGPNHPWFRFTTDSALEGRG